jgi:DMSO reductase anchor subunit
MSRLQDVLFGSRETIAGTVYGTIVVMGAIAAGSHAPGVRPSQLAAIVTGTVLVLWIAHVYSHALGETIKLDRRLDWAELASVARREFAIPLAAVMPVTMLVLGALDVLRESRAVWLAMIFGVVTLVVDGFRYARADRLSRLGTLVTVGINLGLGLLIVGLKAGLGH